MKIQIIVYLKVLECIFVNNVTNRSESCFISSHIVDNEDRCLIVIALYKNVKH